MVQGAVDSSSPMLIVCTNLGGHVRIGEDRRFTVRLWHDSSTLDVLITAESDVDGRVAQGLQQLCTRVLVEHPFAEGPEFLPFVTAVLDQNMSGWSD